MVPLLIVASFPDMDERIYCGDRDSWLAGEYAIPFGLNDGELDLMLNRASVGIHLRLTAVEKCCCAWYFGVAQVNSQNSVG
jgi:hypothetical protein